LSQITPKTITNCWRKADILPQPSQTSHVQEVPPGACAETWGIIFRGLNDWDFNIPQAKAELRECLGAEYQPNEWMDLLSMTCVDPDQDEMVEEIRLRLLVIKRG
jgi:hypothetical protein